MELTQEEKDYLKHIVKTALQKFKEEESTIIVDNPPAFVAGELGFEQFLEQLLKKLE